MKTGIHSITELLEEIKRRAAAKEDLVAPTTALEAIVDNGEVKLAVKGKDVAPINKIAHRQIQGHVKIPADYYDRMLADQPELLCRNINTWLHANRENRLVRRLFGTTRAFLSDAYRPLENENLAAAAIRPLMEADAEVMSAQITDTKLYIKAVDKKVCRELAKVGGAFGDGQHKIVRVASPAITISNSEVGMGAVSILGGVYDGFCSNLATFKERSTRKYHAGARHQISDEETYALLSDQTRAKTDEALWMQVGDIVRAAFDRARFDALCDKIDATTNDKVEDVVQTVSFTSKRFGFNEVEGKLVLDEMVKGGDLSRFGLFNAVTAASAKLEDYDRASEFERVGGQIVELPQSEWRELVAVS
jgi:hypothetical protein